MLRYHKHNHILLFFIPTLLFILVLYLILPFGSEYSMDDLIEQPSISGTFRAFMAEEFAAQAIAFNNPETSDIVIPCVAYSKDGNGLKALTPRPVTMASGTGPLASRDGGVHGGFDFKVTGDGGQWDKSVILIAPISGKVVKNGTNKDKGGKTFTVLTIEGENDNAGLFVSVEHLTPLSSIKVGDVVKQGQVIGTQDGRNGYAVHSHTHVSNCNSTSRAYRMYSDDVIRRFVLHSSVTEFKPSNYSEGVTKEQVDYINNKSRYDSEVVEVQ